MNRFAPYVTPEIEEHRMKVRKWAEAELAPIRDKYEEMNLDGLGKNFPRELIGKMAKEGLFAAFVPKKYGGQELSLLYDIITIEEVARVCGSFSLLADYTPTLGTNPIFTFGTEEQKKKYLPQIVKGEMLVSFGLTEPKWGSDIVSLETTAKKEGDGYIINGEKKFIVLANLADLIVVFAKTQPEAGARGITVFLIDTKREGISFPKQEKKMGLRAIPVSEIKIENVKASPDDILGGPEQEGRGIYVALDTLDHGRCGVAAQALGTTQAALEQATRFASERSQFGQPVGNFEAVQWMLADMAIKLDAARLLTYRAAYFRDLAIKGEMDRRIVTSPVAMAKCYATEVATWAAHRAIQILGGRGFMMDPEYAPVKELPMPETLYRDCRVFEIYEGTNEVQRMVIAREVAQLYGKKEKK